MRSFVPTEIDWLTEWLTQWRQHFRPRWLLGHFPICFVPLWPSFAPASCFSWQLLAQLICMCHIRFGDNTTHHNKTQHNTTHYTRTHTHGHTRTWHVLCVPFGTQVASACALRKGERLWERGALLGAQFAFGIGDFSISLPVASDTGYKLRLALDPEPRAVAGDRDRVRAGAGAEAGARAGWPSLCQRCGNCF